MAISLQWKFQYVASSFDISLCKTLTVQRLHCTPMLTDMAISVHWKLCCLKLSHISRLVCNIKVQDLPQLATNRYRPLGNPQTLELATIIVTSRCMTANNQGKRRRIINTEHQRPEKKQRKYFSTPEQTGPAWYGHP